MAPIRIPRAFTAFFTLVLVFLFFNQIELFSDSYLADITWFQPTFLFGFLMVMSWIAWKQDKTAGSSIVARAIYIANFTVVFGVSLRIILGFRVNNIVADYSPYLGEFVFFGVFEPWYTLIVFLWVPGALIGGTQELIGRERAISLVLPLFAAPFALIPITYALGSIIEISAMDEWTWTTVHIVGAGLVIPMLVSVLSVYLSILFVSSMVEDQSNPRVSKQSEYSPIMEDL